MHHCPGVEGGEGGEALAVEVARGKLGSILEERRKFYENADVVVSLEGYGRDADNGAPTPAVMYRWVRGACGWCGCAAWKGGRE